MSTLFHTLIAQQEEEATVHAQELFYTGVLPEAVRAKMGKFSSMDETFGFAFAEAIGRGAVHRLLDGESLNAVAEKMGVATEAMPLAQIAYSIATLLNESSYPGWAKALPGIMRLDVDQWAMTTDAKKVFAKALTNCGKDVEVVIDAVSGMDVVRSIVPTSVEGPRPFYPGFDLMKEVSAVSQQRSGPSWLEEISSRFRDVSVVNANRLFSGFEVEASRMPRPLDGVSYGKRLDQVSVLDTAFRYAMVEAMVNRAAQALTEGMPVDKVGDVLGKTLVPMGAPFVYGLDHLRETVLNHESPSFVAFREKKNGLAALTPSFREDMLKGLSVSFENPRSVELVDSILQNKDKGERLAVFNQAAETMMLARTAVEATSPTTPSVTSEGGPAKIGLNLGRLDTVVEKPKTAKNLSRKPSV